MILLLFSLISVFWIIFGLLVSSFLYEFFGIRTIRDFYETEYYDHDNVKENRKKFTPRFNKKIAHLDSIRILIQYGPLSICFFLLQFLVFGLMELPTIFRNWLIKYHDRNNI